MRRHEHNQPEDRQPGRGEYLEKGDSETAVIVNMQCTGDRNIQTWQRSDFAAPSHESSRTTVRLHPQALGC
jgi:hypothetical protein